MQKTLHSAAFFVCKKPERCTENAANIPNIQYFDKAVRAKISYRYAYFWTEPKY